MGKFSKKRRHPFLISLGILVLIFLVLVGIAAFYVDSKLDLIDYQQDMTLSEEEEPLLDLEDIETVSDAPAIPQGEILKDHDVKNILVIGTDERSPTFSENARSDSMILVSFNQKQKTVKLVSLERGMGVPILRGEYKGSYDWLTHIFRYGGAGLLLETVRTCFKVDVTDYVRFNFNSVRQIIDSIGGIDMNLSQSEADFLNDYLLGASADVGKAGYHAGINHLSGDATLVYARLRSIDSDWQRVERQRKVIIAVSQAMLESDLSQLNLLLNQVLPLIQTNLSKKEIVTLLVAAPDFFGSTFDQMTIPAEGTYGGMIGLGGRGMFAPDFELNSQILEDFLYGSSENNN